MSDNMPTRFNSTSQSRFNVAGLPSGFNSVSAPDDVTVPAVGVEDVDVALFKLFDKEIPLQVTTENGLKDVPVIFASGEKWAMLKKGQALRDRNSTLLLPLVTIMRTGVEQSMTADITGRGINQQTGELVVKRRLDGTDRGYQNLFNAELITNQLNVAVPPSGSVDVGQLVTSRALGSQTSDPVVQDGGLLQSNRQNNVFEVVVLPAPQFFTATYDVTLWTQYTQHMNQVIEQLVSSFLPQGNAWRLDSPKGYWFVATVVDNVYNAESNFEDMSKEERIIKYKFTVKVPAYVLATHVPGAPVPVKRYVSAPVVSFDLGIEADEAQEASSLIDDPFLGSDDPTLPLADGAVRGRPDQRMTNSTRLYPSSTAINSDDPALRALPRGQQPARYKRITGYDRSGKLVSKLVRVVTMNKFTGETVYVPDSSLGGFTIVVTGD